jgi:hypothetical protein
MIYSAGAGSGRRRRPLEEYCRGDFLKWMRSVIIIAVFILLTVTGVHAEDTPSSNSPPWLKRGPNYPNQQRGPAYPATQSDQEPAPFFVIPGPQQRVLPPRARAEGRVFPSWRFGPFYPRFGPFYRLR